MAKPPQPSKANVADWADNDSVNPYFWITTTTEQTEANMVEKTVKHDHISFTILVNKRGVEKFELLQTFRPEKVHEPLAGVVAKAKAVPKVAAPKPKGKAAASRDGASSAKRQKVVR